MSPKMLMSHSRAGTRLLLVSICAVAVATIGSSVFVGAVDPAAQRAAQRPAAADAAMTATSARAVVNQYCVGCHNDRVKSGGLALDALSLDAISGHPEEAEKIVRKLRLRLMPPAGRPRPDDATYAALATWIEAEVDRVALAKPNPGRTAAVHRLNRIEYRNAVRDLLAVDVDPAALLPPEPSTFGLDNIADVQSLSPALMRRYAAAARKVSLLAVGVKPLAPGFEMYVIPEDGPADARISTDLPLGLRGGFEVEHYFPNDGEYEVRISLKKVGTDLNIEGLEEAHELDVRFDGQRLKRFVVGGPDTGDPPPYPYSGSVLQGVDPRWRTYVRTADQALVVRLPVKAGAHRVSAGFVDRIAEADGVARKRGKRIQYRGYVDAGGAIEPLLTPPSVDSVSVGGPFNDASSGNTPSRRRIFVCQPKGAAEEAACARTILTNVARRAYRRPVKPAEVDELLRLYKVGRSEGTFDDGIQFALEGVLVSPSFLFRVERDPATARPGVPYALSDLELASRLSFFVWSSIPDDTLLDLAVKGQLKNPNVLEREARRMLADPRATALVDSFFNQWLDLRRLATFDPDGGELPGFDESLRTAMQRELELFLRSQLAEDHSVAELLTANYTFANERLARHYGIPSVHGSAFRRITVTDDRRLGLLGKGALLAVTSYPNRTSPVLRGKWVLSNLLGTPPPDPPPNVEGFPENDGKNQPKSVRARLEQHRKNAVCAGCHAQFDPLGLALENFDALGAWRDRDASEVIDASFAMPGTSALEGPAGLRSFLLSHREEMVEAVTEKLLAYALGRVTQANDRPAIRKIVRDAKASDYRWSSLLAGIVNSAPFRMRMPSLELSNAPKSGTVASVGVGR